MGIKFKDITYNNIAEPININLETNQIISVMSRDCDKIDSFFDLLYGKTLPIEGKISIDRSVMNNKTDKRKLKNIRKKVSYLPCDFEQMLFNINILEDIKYGMKNINNEQVFEFLEMLNLDRCILDKNYSELSISEKKKICIICVLIQDLKIVLLPNLSDFLDKKSKQNLIKYLRKEKRKNKLFIISSNNSEFILQASDSILVINENNINTIQDKYSLLGNSDLMKSFDMEVPKVIEFQNKVLNQKSIKLGNRDNINDLIKDVYRNATKINK